MKKWIFYLIIFFIPFSRVLFIYANNENLIESTVGLTVNYVDTQKAYNVLQDPENEKKLLILFDDLKTFGTIDAYLETGAVMVKDKKYVDLSLLKDTVYSADSETLSANIKFPWHSMKTQVLNDDPPEDPKFDKSINAAFLNYDLVFSRTSDQQYVAGIQTLDYISDSGRLTTSIFTKLSLSQAIINSQNKLQATPNRIDRLETNWTSDNIEKTSKLLIGDGITRGASWSGSSRFGGIQYSTNFALKPNFITRPMEGFVGKVEVPSAVDILVNNSSIYHQDLKPGPFDIRNIPLTSGSGDLVIQMKDITGKIQNIIVPFYAVPNLLGTGISNYSFELGLQRQNFGVDSNNYKNILASLDYMRGMNDYWTSGLHFEFLKNNASIGVTNNIKIGRIGAVTASIASNVASSIKSRQKVAFGYSYSGKRMYFGVNYSAGGGKYIDIYNPLVAVSGKPTMQVSAGYSGEKFGNISLNYVTATSNANKKSAIMSANYSKSFLKNTGTTLSYTTDLKDTKKNTSVTLSFSANLGRKSINLNQTRNSAGKSTQLSFSSGKSEQLGWGYNASYSGSANAKNYSATISNSNKYADSTFYFWSYSGIMSQQLEVSGSAVFADRTFFFTRPITNSFVIAKTGSVGNVPIYSSNQLIGRTNSKGKLLIPDIIPYVTTEVKMDETKMPLNTAFETATRTVTPKAHAGIILDFGVRVVQSADMILVAPDDNIIEFDRQVIVEGLEGQDIFTSYRGDVYIRDIKELTRLKGTACNADKVCCSFDKTIDRNIKTSLLNLGKVVCQ